MVCPFSYPNIHSRRLSSAQFEVRNENTGRTLFLLPHEVRQLCKSWKQIADKEDFAWNIFNRIFQKDPSIEERYEQYSKWKNEPFDSDDEDHFEDEIDQPSLVANLKEWETISVEDREECFNQLLCVPSFDDGCSSDEISPLGSVEGTPKLRRALAYVRKTSRRLSRMSLPALYGAGFMRKGSAKQNSSSIGSSSVLYATDQKDSLQNIRNVCFEVLAMNLAPLVLTDLPEINAMEPQVQINGQDRTRSPRRSIEIISQIRRRKIAKIRRNRVLPHLADFVKFWDRVIQLLALFAKTGNSVETSYRLLNLARNLGRRHSDIRMATFQAKVTLLMKNSMLEEIALEMSHWEGRQLFIDEFTISAFLNGRDRKFRIKQETAEKRGQLIRAWYKLIGFVLAEAKDEYLAQMTYKLERKGSAPACEASFKSNLLAAQSVRISRSTEHMSGIS